MATVLVAGAVANKLRNGGEAWVRLSWVLGLRRLGLDVWFVEQIDAATCVGADGEQAPFGRCENRRYFEDVMSRFGLEERSSLLYEGGREATGVSMEDLQNVAADADLLVNISGHLDLEPLVRRVRRKAYVDLDPGFTQFWHADGTAGALGIAGGTLCKREGHEAVAQSRTIGLRPDESDELLLRDHMPWKPFGDLPELLERLSVEAVLFEHLGFGEIAAHELEIGGGDRNCRGFERARCRWQLGRVRGSLRRGCGRSGLRCGRRLAGRPPDEQER